MGKHKKQVSDKRREIPTDLIPEILSRLPAKSIARFRCLSKQWASVLDRPYFTQLFLRVSSARPRLLFAMKQKGKWLFFSATQPLIPDQNSSPLVLDHYKPFPRYFSGHICSSIGGLICTSSKKPMICNPSTGQYIALPKASPGGDGRGTFFGYDPINKIFKVLFVYNGPRVLTLGSGELLWRKIESSISQDQVSCGNQICINGVLYYIANCCGKLYMVVCFDVRFEKFKFLDTDRDMCFSTLINCKGRLGAVRYDFPVTIGGKKRMELMVLDDDTWSKHIYVLPPLPSLWRDLSAKNRLRIVGMTCRGEIVLAPEYTQPNAFSIFYYNVERNTIVRVEIELGIVASKLKNIDIFINHIENLKLNYGHA